jgi:hypothetical protein
VPEWFYFYFFQIKENGLQGIELLYRSGHPNNNAQTKNAVQEQKQTVSNGFMHYMKEKINVKLLG